MNANGNMIYQTNDSCWAIYDGDTGRLVTWGRFGDDPTFMFRRMGFVVENQILPELDGGEPATNITPTP